MKKSDRIFASRPAAWIVLVFLWDGLNILLPCELLAQEPDVSLRISSVSGEPGEEVAVEFRGTVKKPVGHFIIAFKVPRSVVDFIATDVTGTASAHVEPRGVFYKPDPSVYKGFVTGAIFNTKNEFTPLEPGENLLIIKAILKIKAAAEIGEYPIEIEEAAFADGRAHTLIVALEEGGVLQVVPPGGPRPVGDLTCSQEGAAVTLTWLLTETYDAIEIQRNGKVIGTVAGSVNRFLEEPSPGPVTYQVTAIREGKRSIPATKEFLVLLPRPPAVRDLTCTSSNGTVSLNWINGAEYESIRVYRNSGVITELEGSAQSTEDQLASDLFTVYTVIGRRGGIDSRPANCFINDSSDRFVILTEEARASPGNINVPVRVLGTYPEWIQGVAFGLRIDPALARIREISIDGSVFEPTYEFFFYDTNTLDQGETTVGIVSFQNPIRRGGDQYFATVLVDISPDTPQGTVIPVEIGSFGTPPADTGYTNDQGQHRPAEIRSGIILVGNSPIPQVSAATAEVAADGSPGGGEETVGILLRWTNPVRYSAIRLERDGETLEEIPGDSTIYLDLNPGPEVHRYRIFGRQGDLESFPTVVVALPAGVPGTFIRGDVNSDEVKDITDPIMILNHLFLGGPQPGCLDAADADDSGDLDLTDAISVLINFFIGSTPLPPPGPDDPWFDPTPDDLPCG